MKARLLPLVLLALAGCVVAEPAPYYPPPPPAAYYAPPPPVVVQPYGFFGYSSGWRGRPYGYGYPGRGYGRYGYGGYGRYGRYGRGWR